MPRCTMSQPDRFLARDSASDDGVVDAGLDTPEANAARNVVCASWERLLSETRLADLRSDCSVNPEDQMDR